MLVFNVPVTDGIQTTQQVHAVNQIDAPLLQVDQEISDRCNAGEGVLVMMKDHEAPLIYD